ncbi:hypothetical protein [Ralstonia phage RP31]|uniref:Uncharacterized protein n=2 Tax=Ripduovirus RP12 TaxID=2560700 RepID=A0A1L7N1Q7_9CAUD|nr:hypothetical protein FDH28_gp191 [Ralstonia phage RP12]BAW19204.1 hypothetical protein [Ralstonia phage RP12]BAW19490.1 hypothetical protein [Ralstonia phage RP31]
MNYITTFNSDFYLLTWFLVAQVVVCAISAFVAHRVGKYKEWQTELQKHSLAIHAMWVGGIAMSLFVNVEGTTTFLFCCLVIGFVLAVVMKVLTEVRLKRRFA